MHFESCHPAEAYVIMLLWTVLWRITSLSITFCGVILGTSQREAFCPSQGKPEWTIMPVVVNAAMCSIEWVWLVPSFVCPLLVQSIVCACDDFRVNIICYWYCIAIVVVFLLMVICICLFQFMTDVTTNMLLSLKTPGNTSKQMTFSYICNFIHS